MVQDEIAALINQTAETLGFMVYDFNVHLSGENSQILVRIDKIEGISHKDCEIFSKELQNNIDNMGILPRYIVEVSSPGLNRELRTIDDFIRFTGEKVKIIFEGDKRDVVKGTIVKVQGDILHIGNKNDEIELPYKQVVRANLDF